jgi:hypothetical protein
MTKWNTWDNTLCIVLMDDGKLKGSQWNSDNTTALSSITFEGGPTANFSAIAMTMDAMLYGVSNDTILEYSLDASDASLFHYVGQIYP